MVIEFTQTYKINDPEYKKWAIHVARQQVMKQLVAQAIASWSYTMRFEEIDIDGSYTFRMTLDEQPL